MSAYLCSDAHFDVLVAYAEIWQVKFWPGKGSADDEFLPDKLKNTLSTVDVVTCPGDVWAMLKRENVRSLFARYADGMGAEMAGKYRYPFGSAFTALEVLKAVDGYEYQSCEHEGWVTSSACAFADAMRREGVRQLDGYDTCTTWGISNDRAHPTGGRVMSMGAVMGAKRALDRARAGQ